MRPKITLYLSILEPVLHESALKVQQNRTNVTRRLLVITFIVILFVMCHSTSTSNLCTNILAVVIRNSLTTSQQVPYSKSPLYHEFSSDHKI